ncbi:DUF1254 domain-containing protein [Piscinibacter gummiphilus]|uniref:Uncharacterized protein n=1 Tax=Piscinibacter gummiphilus TaxID=946333 RepID=A0A1W6LAG2_9BURK|nr:DUF1214 domain-containing protein [Piscinibacter gummiphilus]ARN21177.1 hypothetical protein A4W93_15450 [Piscinibacter gummiphilus]GLS93736.1 hypothetical protein GCM10007918_10270 [Piscinibacter gummiphilus]
MVVGFVVAFLSATGCLAQDGKLPNGGQPPPGSTPSVKDFDYQIKYQRAFEAVLWNMPAIAIYSFRRGAVQELGLKDNDIISYSGTATPTLEAITANSTTPYIASFTDLRKGPVVLEVPAAGAQGSVYGQVVDAWQFTIADVGPSGIDKGKGGKVLFTPPGYRGKVPKGYLHVASPNYRIGLALRSVPAPGKTVADAYQYAKKLRMYYLSEAAKPPAQRFIDPLSLGKRYPTLPYYDERHFDDLHAVMSVEPVYPQDKVMMGMLASLGIEKGKPFAPDDTTKRAMRQAAIDAWFYLQQWFDHIPKDRLYWPDRHYASLLMTDRNRRFTFTDDERIDLIDRAAEYFWCTFMPKELSDTPATQYMMAMADRDGKLLEAGKLYKLDVPARMPVKQFWALTVYNRATMSFIYSDTNRTTLSSYDLDKMTKNSDGGVTIYVGPKAPAGLESNWIPTAGARPLPAMRLYGPTAEFNDRTFKLPDFVAVD